MFERTSLHKDTKNVFRRLYALVMLAAVLSVFVVCSGSTQTLAAGKTDEILAYEITVKPQNNGELTIDYHVEWKVLESDGIGPVEWVEIGVPNSHTLSYEVLSKTISSMSVSGNYAKIYFDKKYYEGEVISFDYRIEQDYMYEMNYLQEGYTFYEFTPGWFDEIDVDRLVIRWDNNSGKATEWSPSALIKDGYITWESPLNAGEAYTVNVTYPNDAYGFDDTKTIYKGSYDGGYDDYYGGSDSDDGAVIGLLVFVFMIWIVVKIVKSSKSYSSGANLGTQYDTKVTRTKIVYFDECPGCGAPREEGRDKCQYCGRSMIKSEEVIKEENIPKEEKEAMSHTTAGTYRYVSSPNTYVRVNVVRTPRPVSTSSRATTGVHHSSGRSSCAHSSCACASHCACACACACAGGGRAGCSAKDFYNTNLKLRQLELKKKSK